MQLQHIIRRTALVAILLAAKAVFAMSPSDDSAILVSEDFSRVATTANISSQLDDYTSAKGWMGLRVFGNAGDGVQVGVKGDGFLVTPRLMSPGKITVFVEVASLVSGYNNMTVALSEEDSPQYIIKPDGKMIIDDSDITNTFTTLTFTLEYNGACRVRFDPYKVACIRSITVVEGDGDACGIAPLNIAEQKREGTDRYIKKVVQRDGKRVIVFEKKSY